MEAHTADLELEAKHRAMWASGDYRPWWRTFLLPLGPRLVEAAGIGAGVRVLDVAAGTGNASIPAAQAGAKATASDLTPELFDAGRARAANAGVELEWAETDAENLPFEDASYDVVMSCIGAMFAPRHERVADELVRVCRPGGTIALLSWTPDGMLGPLFKLMGPTLRRRRRAPNRRRSGAARSISRSSSATGRTSRRRRVTSSRSRRSRKPRDYGEHFKARYGPTIAIRKNAESQGRAEKQLIPQLVASSPASPCKRCGVW